MSLQGLISGSECATPANPLNQVLKHTDADRSLQQDRIAGPSSSRLQQLPASAAAQIREADAALAQQFFTGEPSPRLANFPAFHAPPLPAMAHAHASSQFQHMNGMQHTGSPLPGLVDSWTVAAQAHVSTPPQSARWASEFHVEGPPIVASQSYQPSVALPPALMSPSYSMSPGLGMGINQFMANMHQNQNQTSSPHLVQQDKGKGKEKPIDFDSAFAEVTASLASSSLEADAAQTSSTTTTSMDTDGAIKSDDVDSFATYEAEFQQWMDAQREDGEYDYGVGLQQAWEGGLGDVLGETSGISFDEEGLPNLGIYQFERENPYASENASSMTRSYLDEAKSLLSGGGSLTEAALLLEAAIQKGETGQGGFEAWLLLGECRSMDEREEQAMQALAEGVRVAEEGGTPGAGMMTLAISYTNESYDRGANALLLRWLRARYPQHPIPQETLDSTRQTAWHSQPLVTDAFISLARSQHAQGIVDPDVQAALGILFFGRADFQRAAECFQAALSLKPEDHRMWNRYGSCLSNGNHPEESLQAYREALRLRPAYTRAIYNVAVACMNVGALKEAAEHLLDALSSQGSGSGGDRAEKSEQCWTTLRRVFGMLGRQDLADLTQSKPDIEIFRREGFDFRLPGAGPSGLS